MSKRVLAIVALCAALFVPAVLGTDQAIELVHEVDRPTLLRVGDQGPNLAHGR